MNAIGQPLSRADGPLKVTGKARYTADVRLDAALHGSIVHSTIANGRVIAIDTTGAEQAPGVVTIFTARTMPRLNPTPKPWSHLHPHGQGYLPMQDNEIHYAGQPIALVVARTLDQAAYAGSLLRTEYEERPPAVFNANSAGEAIDPPQFLWPVTSSVGDAAKGLADATIRIEQAYTTADRHHNQMEPHATLARWGVDGMLTLFDTTQHIFGAKELVAIVLGMPAEKITVVSEFLGGGFGGKAYVWPHTLLAAVAAKALRCPVHIQLTRAQMYSMVGHQPATIQKIALGADRNGKLSGIRHESISPTSVFDNYIEYAANATRFLWGTTGGIATGHKIVHVNRNTPTAMRAPHEALGHVALECAMDELAYSAGIDPVQLRLLNDTDIDPLSGRPFSTRGLRQCLIEGAKRFDWAERVPAPRSMRDGHYLIGQGVAAAVYTHWRWPAKARVRLSDDGTALVEAGMHDLGTGTYTVMRQVAADALGLPADKVTVRLGNTHLPESHAAIGSATMANAGAAVLLAAKAAREKAAHTNEPVVADADYDPVEEANGPKAIFSFAAVFAEVRVDEELGQVRLRRLVGAYDAGRIINPKLARSQAIGGIIWGTGQALTEKSETDPNTARFLHRNYSGYLVPTNADIPDLDVIFVGQFDDEASPLGAKGLGELTAVSVAPAIANAVYHATGRRIRDLPITIEKLLTNSDDVSFWRG
jgi:xanthine dehydrogenase YagR molybdenum-binding subunit